MLYFGRCTKYFTFILLFWEISPSLSLCKFKQGIMHISNLQLIITRWKQCFEVGNILGQSQRLLKAFYPYNSIAKIVSINIYNIASNTYKIKQIINVSHMLYVTDVGPSCLEV